MEFLQDPNKKRLYDKSKYVVRKWEVNFKKKNGRLPSKLDIREASSDVRNAYKLYFRLKTAALEESLMDIDGFDGDVENEKNHHNVTPPKEAETPKESDTHTTNTEETWGIHLNKQVKTEEKHDQSDKLSVNLSFTQKLFENSMLKKLPRKSLSFTRKKSEVDEKPQFLSQPEFSSTCSEQFPTIETAFAPVSVKMVNATPVVSSQSVNLVQTLLKSNCSFSQVRHIDKGWVQRTIGGDCKTQSLDDSNDDVIGNSEDELDNSCSLIQVAKKRRTLSNSFLLDDNTRTELLAIDTTPKRIDFSNLFSNTHSTKPNCTEITFTNQTTTVDESNKKEVDVIQPEKLVEKEDQSKKPKKQKIVRKSTRKGTKKSYVEDDEICDSQPNEEDEQDSKKKSIKSTTIEKRNEEEPYELEYSVKTRIISVPRYKNIKTVIKSSKKIEEKDEKHEGTKQEEKLLKKLESGSINDNFVQINLKKKIYARGKSGRTFSKYKKQMWKKKKNALYGPDMDMGGCDGGVLTCFNCGKTGHFARNCSSKVSDSLLPLENDDEDEACAFPTLEEAAKMAQESALAIRPSKLNNKSDELVDSGESVSEQLNDEFDDELVAITKYLEEEISKLDVQQYMDSTTYVKSYYDLKEDGSLIETPKEVYDTLKKFGHTKFRPGQEQAIMRILSGKSTLVTLSTGTGKSLCYQLPAYLYSKREPCISLIISPLVSLMEDQVTGLPVFLKAACLHTNQTKTQREKVMESIKMGQLNILLVSPEAVVAGEKSSGFGSLLRQLPPIAFACIDEAHCVSQWSHNFRPSYLKICRVLRERLSVNVVLGLTATATRSTSDSIIQHLSIPDGRNGIISDVPLPDNLTLTVSKDINRDQALLNLLLSDRFSECKSIIIYCTRRETCQRVATFLRTCLKNEGVASENSKKRKRHSPQAESYHAGMPASRRRSIQKAFMSGELRIVVATVAFGMGINKSDIRAVIHYNMPMSFESYVQEIGRAGRDGLPAHCHLFLDYQGKDENELRRHIYANTIDRHVIRKLLQRCFIPCSCTTTCPKHEVAFSIQDTVQALDIPEENIETLLCYLELHDKRYVQLLSHVYVNCRIVSYKGPNEIRKAAKDCPPLAMALALHHKNNDENQNILQFPVVEVASAMGWDSGICKHKLKNLEWVTVNGQPKRSQLNVEFSNLGFHLMAPGNLSESALDEALDDLYAHVQEQQRISLLQLHAISSTLIAAAKPSFKMCTSDGDISESVSYLKSKIREYFENPNPLDDLPELPSKLVDEEVIKSDTRALVCLYPDNTFTGRAVARIFQGIQSPNYPAVIWGKCKFWRAHIGTDFNAICLVATREILRMRDL